jgi:hypothetical protein
MLHRVTLFASEASEQLKINTDSLPNVTANQGRIDDIMNVVFSLLGSIAVLIIVLAGLKYITSKGEPQEMAQAKNALLYALVGLAIVIMSYSIVAFVLSNV